MPSILVKRYSSQGVIGEMPVLCTLLQALYSDEKYQATLAANKGWQQGERLRALSPDVVARHALAVIGSGIGG